MGIELTGVQALGLGLEWGSTTSQRKIAQDVLDTLSDRRVLHQRRNLLRPSRDALPCFLSAQECRALLTEAIKLAKVGSPLRLRLQEMRSAFTGFVELAGPNAEDFRDDASRFRDALEDLGTSVRQTAGTVAEIRGVSLPEEFAP